MSLLFSPARIFAEGRCPLRPRVVRFEVGRRDHGDRPLAADRGIHVQHEVAAAQEVPGLQDDRVALPFNHIGDPLRPSCIRAGVADEEITPFVRAAHLPCLSHLVIASHLPLRGL